MKLFQTSSIRELDRLTMEMEPISSLELMNRAAAAIFEAIRMQLDAQNSILVVAGAGNNGGDALCVARLLLESGYKVEVMLCQPDAKVSRDTLEQLIRLQQTEGAVIHSIDSAEILDLFHGDWSVQIDGLFGTGLNRPLQGYYANVVAWMNQQQLFTVSIDLPSGLFGEDNRSNLYTSIVRANLTVGLQFPRLAYLMPENESFVGNWKLVDIGIHPTAIAQTATTFGYTTREDAAGMVQKRSNFAHKGSFGKVLLATGCQEMTGAAILSAMAALRSGAGLVYVHTPEKAVPIIQSTIPEALIINADTADLNPDSFDAVGIGSGIGSEPVQQRFLERLLSEKHRKLVLDADALNYLSTNRQWLDCLPENCILTPHPKECDRLLGVASSSGYERLEKALAFAVKHRIYVLLKGAYTACIEPDGTCWFNSNGNPGMATAGSGDVLTGIIVSLLAQGYTHSDACRLSVFLHGLSGDLALTIQSFESLIASDIANSLGQAFNTLRNEYPL